MIGLGIMCVYVCEFCKVCVFGVLVCLGCVFEFCLHGLFLWFCVFLGVHCSVCNNFYETPIITHSISLLILKVLESDNERSKAKVWWACRTTTEDRKIGYVPSK